MIVRQSYHFLSFPALKVEAAMAFLFHHAKLFCLFFAFSLCVCFIPSIAELQRFKHPVKADDGSLISFLVVGDWGRRGLYNQSQVALQVITQHICSPFP